MADHIFQKPNESTWYARLDVPRDVRDKIGKSVFKESLGTSNKSEAMHRRHAPLARWRALIEQARQPERPTDLGVPEALGNNLRYLAETAETINSLQALKLDSLQPIISKHLEDLAQSIDDSGHPAPGILQNELLAAPNTFKPNENPLNDEILHKFRSFLETHKKSNIKTFDSHMARLKTIRDHLLASRLPLNYDNLHDFLIFKLRANGTRKQYIWSGNSFWKWAVKYDLNFKSKYSTSANPFDNHDLPTTEESQKKTYIAFSKSEAEQLYSRAIENNDDLLANLIKIAAYTGCRLEEIGRFKARDIQFTGETPYSIKVEISKTESGKRIIPIHPDLAPLIADLIANKNDDGYLLPGGQNQYSNRLDYLSKRFGRLKNSLKYTSLHTFHSLRKTTATELHYAGAKPEIIAHILGHEVGNITFDTYIPSGSSIDQKMIAIQLIKFNMN